MFADILSNADEMAIQAEDARDEILHELRSKRHQVAGAGDSLQFEERVSRLFFTNLVDLWVPKYRPASMQRLLEFTGGDVDLAVTFLYNKLCDLLRVPDKRLASTATSRMHKYMDYMCMGSAEQKAYALTHGTPRLQPGDEHAYQLAVDLGWKDFAVVPSSIVVSSDSSAVMSGPHPSAAVIADLTGESMFDALLGVKKGESYHDTGPVFDLANAATYIAEEQARRAAAAAPEGTGASAASTAGRAAASAAGTPVASSAGRRWSTAWRTTAVAASGMPSPPALAVDSPAAASPSRPPE